MDSSTSNSYLIKQHLKNRCRNKEIYEEYEKKFNTVYNLMRRCLEEKETNSLILIGPRGCGKTTLINSVLKVLLQKQHFADVWILKLNGYVHTDDKLTLKSIAIQLNLQELLDESGIVFGTFAENFNYLLEYLRGDNKHSQSIIILLDEFDLFCNNHQTLLYNLLDVSHKSKQTSVCLIGITCRIDVVGLLEKRVKSRYSHRQVYLKAHKNNGDKPTQIFQNLLKLDNASANLKNSRSNLIAVDERYVCRKTYFKFTKNFIETWNDKLEKLSINSKVKKYLEKLYVCNKDEIYFEQFMFRLISTLNEDHNYITNDDITSLISTCSSDYDEKVVLLQGLSILEICLIIAMNHHCDIYDHDPFNFEIIYKRLRKFTEKSQSMQDIGKSIALKAFEHLRKLEMILPLDSDHKVKKEFQMYNLSLLPCQVKKLLSNYTALPTDVFQWANILIL